MGVVKTMGSVHLPPAELGLLISSALVGTFVGILLAYVFVSPLSPLLEQKAEEFTKMFQAIKVTLLANLNATPQRWRWSLAARCCIPPIVPVFSSWRNTSNKNVNVKLAQRDPVPHTLGALPLSLGESAARAGKRA